MAGRAGDDVARLDGAAARHVFGRRNEPDHVQGQAQLAASVSAAITAAEPLMSNFISSIAPGSLSEMPPVSNVMPLPTSTMGAFGAFGPLYSMTMKRGGTALPWVTARRHPIFSLRMAASSSTVTFTEACDFASAFAWSAR